MPHSLPQTNFHSLFLLIELFCLNQQPPENHNSKPRSNTLKINHSTYSDCHLHTVILLHFQHTKPTSNKLNCFNPKHSTKMKIKSCATAHVSAPLCRPLGCSPVHYQQQIALGWWSTSVPSAVLSGRAQSLDWNSWLNSLTHSGSLRGNEVGVISKGCICEESCSFFFFKVDFL